MCHTYDQKFGNIRGLLAQNDFLSLNNGFKS